MKLKKMIKVGPHIVEVNYPYVFTERSDVDALACTRTKKIYVRDNAEGEQMPDMCIAENMFHELLHHVCYQATGSLTLFDDENKHEVFSNYLFMVKEVMVNKCMKHWKWINVPLDIEAEIASESWADKVVWELKDGEWKKK